MTMGQNVVLDDLDQAIIALLRLNGRATNQEVGEKLGITPSTVSIRIRRMEKANKLRVVAVSDFAAHDVDVLIPVAIKVHGRPVQDVANELVALTEVFALHLVSGPYDIDALLAFRGHDELMTFVRNELPKVSGIRSIDLAIASDVLKYNFDVAPIDGGRG